MGFYRTAEEMDKALRERARRAWREYVLLGLRMLAYERQKQQAKEDAWYEKFKQAQEARKVGE